MTLDVRVRLLQSVLYYSDLRLPQMICFKRTRVNDDTPSLLLK